MISRNTCRRSFFSLLLLTSPFLLTSTTQAASNAQGQPFKQLQDQVDQLSLNPTSDPIEVTVNCPGDSINTVLSEYAGIAAPLIITINGNCDEAVSIPRNNVILRGATNTDGLTLSTNAGAISAASGLSGIVIENMTLNLAGGWGIVSLSNNTMNANNVVINNSGAGLVSAVGGHLTANNVVIDGNGSGTGYSGIGAIVGDDSVLVLYSSTIQDTAIGVYVHSHADAYLGNFVGTTSVIQNNIWGVRVTNGSNVSLGDIEITNNLNSGVEAYPGTSIAINNALGSSTAFTSIHNNNIGMILHQNSNVTILNSSLQVDNNNGYGITCESNVAISIVYTAGTLQPLTGNNGAGAQTDGCSLP